MRQNPTESRGFSVQGSDGRCLYVTHVAHHVLVFGAMSCSGLERSYSKRLSENSLLLRMRFFGQVPIVRERIGEHREPNIKAESTTLAAGSIGLSKRAFVTCLQKKVRVKKSVM